MKRVEILVEESLYEFYRKVGAQAGGLPAERGMATRNILPRLQSG